jgi:hypothetical protein
LPSRLRPRLRRGARAFSVGVDCSRRSFTTVPSLSDLDCWATVWERVERADSPTPFAFLGGPAFLESRVGTHQAQLGRAGGEFHGEPRRSSPVDVDDQDVVTTGGMKDDVALPECRPPRQISLGDCLAAGCSGEPPLRVRTPLVARTPLRPPNREPHGAGRAAPKRVIQANLLAGRLGPAV